MSLKRRVSKLEEQSRGDDSLTFTWEEFEQINETLGSPDSDRGAEQPGDRREAPANIDRLLERWRRAMQLRRSQAESEFKAAPPFGEPQRSTLRRDLQQPRQHRR